MKEILTALRRNTKLSDYQINIHHKQSYELFFVKSKLETVRRTDTCDREVKVFVDHGEYKGDSQFFVYPSTDETQLDALIEDAASKAAQINNKSYELVGEQTGSYEVESNFRDYDMPELAALVSQTVFGVKARDGAALNAVEIFLNKHTETVVNSRGLHKTQVRYEAMVEAIPTYNGQTQSVELYEQYNFGSYDAQALASQIGGKLEEVEARYRAVRPDFAIDCPVVLGPRELMQLFMSIARDLNYSAVYAHSNLRKKGDLVQKNPTGDRISITMTGQLPGCVRSAKFDEDGMSLGSIELVKEGQVMAYYGSNRYGQYLGLRPTGNLGCMKVAPGSVETFPATHLEVISMSGLQVDAFNDYIGGEVRLAYYRSGETMIPVTGISISGKLSQVLESIRFTTQTTMFGAYQGPKHAVLTAMTVF